MHERDLQAAQALVRQYKVDPGLLYPLAQAFSAQPITAIELYQRLVAFEVSSGKNADYKRAVKLLVECQGILKIPAHQVAFLKMLAEVKATFKAKRNFMQYMSEAGL